MAKFAVHYKIMSPNGSSTTGIKGVDTSSAKFAKDQVKLELESKNKDKTVIITDIKEK